MRKRKLWEETKPTTQESKQKQYKYLYQKMLQEDIVRKAYKKLRKGKTKRIEIQNIDANLDIEVAAMQEMISATRLASKMDRAKQALRGYYQKHIQAMLSYIGWFDCTNTYNCYEERVKPFINVGKLKSIISKLKRRQNHETMDRGTLLGAAQ